MWESETNEMKTTLGDKILIALLILLNGFLFVRMGSWGGAQGDWVVIDLDRKEIAWLPLSGERVIPVKGRLGITEVVIHNGRVRIRHSPCKNKICIKSGPIQYADRLVACIPNRVVVRIAGKPHRGLDAVVG